MNSTLFRKIHLTGHTRSSRRLLILQSTDSLIYSFLYSKHRPSWTMGVTSASFVCERKRLEITHILKRLHKLLVKWDSTNFRNLASIPSWPTALLDWSWFKYFWKHSGLTALKNQKTLQRHRPDCDETQTSWVMPPAGCICQVSNSYLETCRKKSVKLFAGWELYWRPLSSVFCPPEGHKLPKHDENQ